jgi:WD40 repeat protein
MTLTANTRLGPYQIENLIGTGGMGEVYRARDPRLGREVAVKLVTADGAASPERLRRFETEARAAAQLAHPNVVTVFDVGTHDGHPYLVLELLDGETLRETLRRGVPLLRQAVAWTLEVARGLGAAHERGIVHRDLKPENIFLTRDGRVKVLDFGLAKLHEPFVSSEAETESPTAVQDTKPGVILGTVGYMSPEQVNGHRSDARADVFALGSVLYELVSGRRAFGGSTTAQVLAAILRDEPPSLMSLQHGVPASLEAVVRRCHGKRPSDRFSSGNEVAAALETVLASFEPSRRSGVALDTTRGPYPGLRSFTEAEAERFFGRESEIEALWEKLRQRRLLALIGPSGAGKTSFVRAGLVPARPSGWGAIVATPGSAPLRALAQALVGELPSDPDTLRELLAFDDPEVALRMVRKWRESHLEALLVVDQFEELFTLNPPETHAAFAALLGRLAGEADVHVLLSLRDDFLIRCHEHETLAPVFQNLTPLLALGGEGLRRALVEPAKREGFSFEDDGLVDEMLESVSETRGALPLLAFAAARLWDKRDQDQKLLTRKAYQQIGGVAGALAQHAEQTLERIGFEREPIVRELFRNLVTSQWTRAVGEREQLLSVFPDREVAGQVLDALVDARLLTSYEVRDAGRGASGSSDSHPERGSGARRARDLEREGQATPPAKSHLIEIVHESLIRAWPRLVRWQAQDEEGAVLRDQLKQAARLWEDKGRSPDVLWTGTAYREFELWRDRYQGKLTALEDEYARAMEARVQRQRRLRRAALATVVGASLAVAAVVSVLGYRESRARARAEAEALRAEASKLVALGKLDLDVEPTASLAYARKSLETRDTPEGRRLALEALWRGPTAHVMPAEACNHVVASPDGAWLACSTVIDTVQLFSSDGTTVHTVGGTGARTAFRHVLFSTDSRKLATFTGGDAATVVWSVEGDELDHLEPGGAPHRFEGDELLLEVPTDHTGLDIEARTLGSTTRRTLLRWPKGRSLLWVVDPTADRVVFSEGPALLARPLTSGSGAVHDTRLGVHPAAVRAATNDRATGDILSVDLEHGIRVWSGRTLELLHARQGLDPSQWFPLPALDHSGTRLAWGSRSENAVVLWDLAGPADAAPLLMRRRSGSEGNATFLGDGPWLAKAEEDAVTLWATDMPWPRVLSGHGTRHFDIAFTPDSSSLVSCQRDPGQTGVWPLTAGGGRWRPLQFPGRWGCYGLAMSPTGEQALVASPGEGVGGLLLPVDGGVGRMVVEKTPGEVLKSAALSPDGRWAAVAPVYAPDPELRRLHIVDLETNETHVYPLPGATAESPTTGGIYQMRFADDDLLLAGARGGARLLDVTSGESELLRPAVVCLVDASPSSHVALLACVSEGPDQWTFLPPAELSLVDLETRESRFVTTHGTDLEAVALDTEGRIIATGDSTGAVRVGRADGSEPHLLLGPKAGIGSLDLSPDGEWVAAATASEIWLWPMPDLDRPPLHTLPHDALLAKLDTLTNLRVVEDEAAPTGYRVDVGPFPGWKDVPTW